MFHLKLCKGLSYSGIVSATKENPDVFVEEERTALAAVSTGYFRLLEVSALEEEDSQQTLTGPVTVLDVKTLAELKEYAKENGIELSGATKKEDVLAAIIQAERMTEQFVGSSSAVE